jgi:hypothetical protein
MMHDELFLARLADRYEPVRPHPVARRLAPGIALGFLVTLCAVLCLLGVRPDLARAVRTPFFWGKLLFTFSLGVCGLILSTQLLRPDSSRLRGWWISAIPLSILTSFSFSELIRLPAGERFIMVSKPIWLCLPLIVSLSIPIYVGLLWSYRVMAPTRLAAAGAAAGLTASGFAATAYCLFCQGSTATYLMSRYVVAIAATVLLGGFVGRCLFRWR